MRLDVLMSCMHQKDAGLVERSRITGSVTVINQCDREDFQEYSNGRVKMYSTTDRGLTKSRNLAIAKSDAEAPAEGAE